MFINKRAEYDTIAREWTEKYAKEGKQVAIEVSESKETEEVWKANDFRVTLMWNLNLCGGSDVNWKAAVVIWNCDVNLMINPQWLC